MRKRSWKGLRRNRTGNRDSHEPDGWDTHHPLQSYPTINLVLAGVIGLVFVYAAVFPAEKDQYPIPSQYKLITGENTNSTGLSRAFSELIRLNFEEAQKYNRNALEVFAFLFIQLVMRIILTIVHSHTGKRNLLIRSDILGSILLFILCFKDMMGAMYS